jgi:hypothetical protein
MLRSVRELKQYAIGASDGLVGTVADFFFDDRAWVLRYLVVDTGPWFERRKVLIPPRAIGHANWIGKVLEVSLSRAEVKASPDIDTEQPVSRQHELQFLAYYGYPSYWSGRITPSGIPLDGTALSAVPAAGDAWNRRADHHLRSCNAVMNYRVQASDGAIGRIGGILIDEVSWAIRYLVVDTGNWGFGHRVLLAPEWIDRVDWAGRSVTVDLARQAVREAPAFEPDHPLDCATEAVLQSHYADWEREVLHENERSY